MAHITLHIFYSIGAVFYLLASFCLTVAVVLALDVEDPAVYNLETRADGWRLACETAVMVWVLVTIVQEVIQCFRLEYNVRFRLHPIVSISCKGQRIIC